MHNDKDKFNFHLKYKVTMLKNDHNLDVYSKKFATQYDSAYEIARYSEINNPENEVFKQNLSFKDYFYNFNLVLKNEFNGNVNDFVTWWEKNKTKFISWNQKIEKNFIELYKSKIKDLSRGERYKTYEEWLKKSYPVLDKKQDKMFRILRTISVINELVSENKNSKEVWSDDQKLDWHSLLLELDKERYYQEEIQTKQLRKCIKEIPKHSLNTNLLQIEKLIDEQNNLYIANQGNCLLNQTIEKYDSKLLELLLKKGVDPNNIWNKEECATDNQNSTLNDFVIFMIEEEDNFHNKKSENLDINSCDKLQKMLEILIDWGANLDAKNEEDKTPMSLLYGNSFAHLDPECKVFKTALITNLKLIKKLNLIKIIETNNLYNFSLDDLNAGNSEKSYCINLFKSIIKDCREKLESAGDENVQEWEKHFGCIISIVIAVINQNKLDIKVTDYFDYYNLSLKHPNLENQINSHLNKLLHSQESDLVDVSANFVNINMGINQETLTENSDSNQKYSQSFN